tara:strand:+ start:108 stop:1292 length:1185 start_codon:yes stop_codon:yes gene_type:complete
MAITDKEQGVWNVDQVYNKQNQGSIWPLPSSVGDPLEMWAWGGNHQGSLGLNQAEGSDVSSPTQIGTDIDWKDPRGGPMGAGMGIFQAVKNDGTLWRCGWNYQGSMGQPYGDSLSSPTQIGADTDWKFCTGRLTAGAIKTDGTFWTWGRNDWGQLGQNNRTPYASPKQVGTESTWNNVTMEGLCNFGTKTDGTLWAWGVNEQGSLGLNQAHGAQCSSPTQLPGTTWEAVSTNQSEAAVALKTDGTLWSWGKGEYGRNGNNTSDNFSSPVQVGTGTDWADAVTWNSRTVALKTDGELWTWGRNTAGQLGLNDLTSYSSPKQIPGTWTSVGMSGAGSMGVKDGKLYVWGGNSAGSLGLNAPTSDHRSSPTQVGTSTKWKSASKSYTYSYIACKEPE